MKQRIIAGVLGMVLGSLGRQAITNRHGGHHVLAGVPGKAG